MKCLMVQAYPCMMADFHLLSVKLIVYDYFFDLFLLSFVL